jgi:hypothetical protein
MREREKFDTVVDTLFIVKRFALDCLSQIARNRFWFVLKIIIMPAEGTIKDREAEM